MKFRSRHSRIFSAGIVLAALIVFSEVWSAPSQTSFLSTLPFTQTLASGSSHAEVRTLQEFLSTLPGIYPEQKVTGYFGPLTRGAVIRFQTTYGISPVGVVGPQTRSKLNELHAPASVGSSVAPTAPTATSNLSAEIPDRPDYDLESIAQEIHRKINRERLREDAPKLAWNDTLAEVARLHSEDQARDNVSVVPYEKPCTYPILRHIGLTRETFSVIDRLLAKTRGFRRGGENIVTFPTTSRSYYRPEGARVRCVDVPQEHDEEGTMEERIAKYQAALRLRQNLIASTPSVTWVRREWQTEGEIAERAVELWLSSPGHKKNMLNSSFEEAGIGITWVNHYLIITQVFTD